MPDSDSPSIQPLDVPETVKLLNGIVEQRLVFTHQRELLRALAQRLPDMVRAGERVDALTDALQAAVEEMDEGSVRDYAVQVLEEAPDAY